jgi:UDP-N-acetylglucosamine transferase subunit ALG13
MTSPIPTQPFIYVTVGTDHHQFDRLTNWVDTWLTSRPDNGLTCLVQHGASPAPKVAHGVDYLDKALHEEALRRSVAVVTHGGPGSIVDARRSGKFPIVVPRDNSLGEHIDDHQMRFAVHIARRGWAHPVANQNDFFAALDEAIGETSWFSCLPEDAAGSEAIARVHDLAMMLMNRKGPKVVYLAGMGRSGSTLIERTLGELPGFVNVGELVFIWQRGLRNDERCGCGERFSGCKFWQEVGAVGFGGWNKVNVDRAIELKHEVDRNRHVPKLAAGSLAPRAFREARREYLAEYLEPLYAAISEVSGASVIVDSSKHTSYAYLLKHLWSIDLRVVQIIRNAYGVAYSWQKEVPRPELDNAEAMPQYSSSKSATLWTVHNSLLRGLQSQGVPVDLVRYEDFLAEPAGTLRAIAEFAGEPQAAADLGFLTGSSATLAQHHSVSGNPMRFQSGPLQLKEDTAWQAALPARDKRIVSALTWPARRRFGY